ncbi:ABC transporter permease [Mycoplasma tauri]|uniref:ABC transporter permease n=1 Tax=Mycoplasma tauri TaxID=547987 RepID=UPI001CBC39AD|nr:ABC transporter permease [Mycoplasma tauri]MBZ4218336.1 ABC transporter permease [Mycoplasma tauri]
MWRLFKEVLKSFSKNKVMVFGLGILVFLTSVVFSLLSTLKSSMVKGFHDYKNVSKLHNVSLDFNFPTQGAVYNQGYFVNGKDSTQDKKVYEPVTYEIKNSNNDERSFENILYSPKSDFISLAKLKYVDNTGNGQEIIENSNNIYFKKTDLQSLYYTYITDKNNDIVSFELGQNSIDADNAYFILKGNVSKNIFIYKQDNKGIFSPIKEEYKLNLEQDLEFDRNYKLGDLLQIKSFDEPNEELLAYQVSPLFIDVVNKKITADYSIGKSWLNIGKGVIIHPDVWIKKLGFTKRLDNNFVFVQNDVNKDLSALLDYKTGKFEKINDLIDVKKTWKLKDFYDEELKTYPEKSITIRPGRKIKIDKSLLASKNVKTYFERWNYHTSFLNDYKEKWTGAFHTFMSYLEEKKNDKSSAEHKIWNDLKDFSYWEKKEKTTIIPYDDLKSERNVILNSKINEKDLMLKLFTTKGDEGYKIPNDTSSEPYRLTKDNAKTILELEKYLQDNNLSINQKLELINNKDIKSIRFNYIKQEAYEVTKNLIVDKVKNIVNGEENIGLRKSITVDSINDINGEHNVFHFIDAGNDKFEVDGIKTNVGKLYNEQFNPSKLNSINFNSEESFYKDSQVPPYYASLIIQSIGRNLYPNPEYIEPVYEFVNIVDVNPLNNKHITIPAKVVMLNNYMVTNDNRIIDKEVLNNTYKKLNFGIAFFENTYKLVTSESNGNSIIWKVVYPDGVKNKGFDKGTLSKWMITNNLTIATENIKVEGNGWVKNDPLLNNLWYIPVQYLSPKTELLNDILESGNVNYLSTAIEQQLLNSELVKFKYISPEHVFALSNAIKESLNENKFANVFISGKINTEILPKIIFDIIHKLSHNQSGDMFKSLIVNIFENVKSKIKSISDDIARQKEYLLKEVTNIYSFIEKLTKLNINKYINAEDLVNLSKDPKEVINAIQKIILSIDFYKFSDLAHEWYGNQWKKKIEHNGAQYTVRLSTGTLINWSFKSIDQKTLKDGLITLINNLDINNTLDLSNSSSFLSKLLDYKAPFMKEFIAKILTKINFDGDYNNFKDGLIYIIKNIDLQIISDYIDKHMKLEFIDYKKTYPNYENNSETVLSEKVALHTIRPSDGMMAFIYGIFSSPGSNSGFKKNLIKMFNLSDKVIEKEIEINNQKYKIYLPDKDDNKLSFFDFIPIFTDVLGAKKNQLFKNYVIEQELLNVIKNIKNLQREKENKLIFFGELNMDSQKTLKHYKIASELKDIIDEKIIKHINNILLFISQTKNSRNNFFITSTNATGADLLKDLYNFNDDEVNFTWKTIKGLLRNVDNITVENDYALGAQAFDIFLPWINMFVANNGATHSETIKFINDLLNLSINSEILSEVNKKTKKGNLPLYDQTQFGVSNSFLRPELVNIFDYDGKKFVNEKVQNLVNNNKKFKEFIINQKSLLIELFGLIGASKEYVSSSKAPNGIYYETIRKFLNNYLSKNEFWESRQFIIPIVYEMRMNFPVELFGISRILINPILRSIYPQVVASFLVSQEQNEANIKGNLAYIVTNKIGNFEEIIQTKKVDLNKLFEHIWRNNDTSLIPIDFNEEKLMVLDGAQINKLFKKENSVNVFGLDFIKLVNQIINNIVEPKEMRDIVFNDARSYLAKVNYAYLIRNNKAVYTGEIPSNSVEIEKMINLLDDKYVINVSGIKYLIIGEDNTVDYIYPVIDENNLQVNTQKQALVYVNNYGFSRIVAAYQGNVIKKNLLIKNGSNKSDSQVKKEITDVVNSLITDANKIQRVFLYNEIDPINPERALRITTIDSMIKTISVVIVVMITVFAIVVSVAIIFIIRRYIAKKAKVFGILLAQGYKPIEIAISLTAFAMVTAIVGGVLGYVIGFRTQTLLQNVFSNYWTLPKEVVPFSIIGLLFIVFVPFFGMSLLIIVVSLLTLRKKPNSLITGDDEIPKGKWFYKVKYKFVDKKNVKKRFSYALAYSSFWKLTAFSGSVLLTSIATMFGIANIKTFSKTINSTYENKNYKFKVDLESPTIEGGYYTKYDLNDLSNSLYTPIGNIAEGNREVADYFKPGKSSIINPNDIVNGNPINGEGHILSQFGVNVAIDASVAADPWLVAYNGMPDSQKAKIDLLRDKVGYQLEWSQSLDDEAKYINDPNKPVLKVNPENGFMSYEDAKGKKYSFFKYYKPEHEKQGSFKIAYWNNDDQKYEMKSIKTGIDGGRDHYREFLVNAYRKINLVVKENLRRKINNEEFINPIKGWKKNQIKSDYWISDKSNLDKAWNNDFFISFGGVLFDKNYDETYTYLNSTYNKSNVKIYGYKKPEKGKKPMINLFDDNGNNLFDTLYNYKYKENENIYPILVNEVFKRKNNISNGQILEFKINNRIDRYKQKILEKVHQNNHNNKVLTEIKNDYENKRSAKFKVIGFIPTYINNELVTTQEVANKLVGFKSGVKEAFNGVMTMNHTPTQVTDSTSLYSLSGYWSGLDGFSLDSLDSGTIHKMFDQIFGINVSDPSKGGVLQKQHGLSKDEIAKFLDSSASQYSENLYKTARNNARVHIENFSKIYDNKLYIALSTSIDSKDIEVGFTKQVGSTIENITILIIAISFIISLIILIIMSTIMVSEHEKNIAIWSILGYTQKEKMSMFFKVFIPFIIGALLLAIPIVLLIIQIFNIFLLSSSSIALLLTLKWHHVLITTILMFGVFIITSLLVWYTISKMKPVDLLKGK